MRYGLARYTGAGSALAPYRPVVADVPGWSAVDLRPDATRPDGWALVAVPTTDPRATVLGDTPDDISDAARRAVESRLAVTIDRPLPVRDLVRAILAAGDTTDPRRWNPLRPTRRRLPDGRRARALEVWLGGALLVDDLAAADGPGTTLTDDFNVADTGTLSGDLTWAEVVGDWSVVTNQANLVSPNGADCGARAEHDLATSNTYAQAIPRGSAQVSTFQGACCRFSSSAFTCYVHAQNSTGSLTAGSTGLSKIVAGTRTSLADWNPGASTVGHVVRVEADGSTIRAVYDAVTQVSVTDTSIGSGTRAGIFGRAAGANRAKVDDFEAGDLATPAPPPPNRPPHHLIVR